MDDFHREFILDHYKRPRNFGTLEDPDITNEEDNPFCGDRIRIDLKLGEGRVVDVRFDGRGCAISTAAASILTDKVKGAPLERVRAFSKEEMLEALGIPLSPIRLKCGLLALKVLKAGLYGIKGWPGEEE
ncbi:MAG: iron-sulfur cluster assembly scaffold protein [Candidatus Methylomirabilales bacterium]|nr:iron-sulfur cluster assembly scaffold protein [candidate division NC10 bacterium]MCH7895583.1 iron-sulfur cluster assembly scaffold protein [candidate division NC10 bacterium]MCZ6550946.1 iron-sulfur cluster assembly scaffold protein [candidate division NC10 bacterium]